MLENSTILVTGFEPFANMGRNPSTDAVLALGGSTVQFVTEILPVEYRRASERMEMLLEAHHPAAWIGFGLSQRATAITLERVALNLDDATIADNKGDLRRGQCIAAKGDDVYRSTLPLDLIAMELEARNIPSTFSDTAGRFVCNHVFYHTLWLLRQKNLNVMAGFIHVPWPSDWDCESPALHSVTLLTIIEAARICVDVILREINGRNFLAT